MSKVNKLIKCDSEIELDPGSYHRKTEWDSKGSHHYAVAQEGTLVRSGTEPGLRDISNSKDLLWFLCGLDLSDAMRDASKRGEDDENLVQGEKKKKGEADSAAGVGRQRSEQVICRDETTGVHELTWSLSSGRRAKRQQTYEVDGEAWPTKSTAKER